MKRSGTSEVFRWVGRAAIVAVAFLVLVPTEANAYVMGMWGGYPSSGYAAKPSYSGYGGGYQGYGGYPSYGGYGGYGGGYGSGYGTPYSGYTPGYGMGYGNMACGNHGCSGQYGNPGYGRYSWGCNNTPWGYRCSASYKPFKRRKKRRSFALFVGVGPIRVAVGVRGWTY